MTAAGADPPNGRHRASPALFARAGWGTLLVARPDLGLQMLGAPDTSGPAPTVLRILGARHLAQAAVELARGPAWRRPGAVVDVLHATTSVLFAALDREWRRAALTDATIATLFAATEFRAAGATA